MITLESIPYNKILKIEIYDKTESLNYEYFPFIKRSLFRKQQVAGFYYKYRDIPPTMLRCATYPTSARILKQEHIIQGRTIYDKPQIVVTDIDGNITTWSFDTLDEANEMYFTVNQKLQHLGIQLLEKRYENDYEIF